MTPEEIRNLTPNEEHVHDSVTDSILLYKGFIEGYHVFDTEVSNLQIPDHALVDFTDRFTPSEPPPEPEVDEDSEPENTEENSN